jgi:hypothetical protein
MARVFATSKAHGRPCPPAERASLDPVAARCLDEDARGIDVERRDAWRRAFEEL